MSESTNAMKLNGNIQGVFHPQQTQQPGRRKGGSGGSVQHSGLCTDGIQPEIGLIGLKKKREQNTSFIHLLFYFEEPLTVIL